MPPARRARSRREVEDEVGQRQRVAGLDVALAEAEQGEPGQHLGGGVRRQQEVIGVGGPVRQGQMAGREQGKPRGRGQVVPPGVLEQAARMAQGQAVRRGGKIGEQNVGRAARKSAAEGVHRLRAVIQGRAPHGVAGLRQCVDERGGGAAFFIGGEDKDVQHGGTDHSAKISRVAAGER